MNSWWLHLLTVSVPAALGVGVILLAAVAWGRHAFTEDYPPAIRERVAPPTRRETVAAWLWGGLFTLSLPVACFATMWAWYTGPDGGPLSAYAAGVAFLILFILVDLVLVDWLVVCWLRPSWVVPPGTEDAEGWDNYAFHVRASFTPKVLVTLVVVPAVLLIPLTLLG